MRKCIAATTTLIALAVTLAIAVQQPARAGTIVSVGTVAGPGLGTVNVFVINTPSEGNDNQPGGPGFDGNLVVPIKRFDHAGLVDIEFSTRSSDPSGTTEYRFLESVDNNTGTDWDLYTMQLGFGVGDSFALSGAADGLDFDFPALDPAPMSSAFPFVAWGEDEVVFSGGIHSSGSEVYQFRIDVPDGIESFTLRQSPHLVPEPSSIALGGLGLVALVAMAVRPAAEWLAVGFEFVGCCPRPRDHVMLRRHAWGWRGTALAE